MTKKEDQKSNHQSNHPSDNQFHEQNSSSYTNQSDQGQIQQLKAQCDEYKNDLKRLAAEFDNYKKRTAKELQQAKEFGKITVLVDLLEIYQELLISLNHLESTSDPQKLKEGIHIFKKKLSALLEAYKIKEIDCTGEPDPYLHEVIFQTEGEPEGKIAQVIKRGYLMADKVLIPAKVSVYKKPKNNSANSEANSSNEQKTSNAQNTSSQSSGEQNATKNVS
jgi:molecular chaperone GrpE